MSKSPLKPARHLHVFGLSLLLIVAALAVFLFGVKLESSVSGKGIVSSGGVVEIRTYRGGFFREERSGDNTRLFPVGSTVSPGTVLGRVISEGAEPEVIAVPNDGVRRLIVEAPVSLEGVFSTGSKLYTLAPLEAETNRIADLWVRLEIEEKYFGEVRTGQDVRLESNMYHHRVHGVAAGKVARLEPIGEPGNHGTRVFHAWVKVEQAPFPLLLGSGVKAEIVAGRKRTYQIILEH